MGYCTVTGADELAAHAALKMSFELFRGAFAHHGGAAIYHPGDAVLAEFSTVAGAVAAAEGVQAAIAATRASGRRGLEFRIGVNLLTSRLASLPAEAEGGSRSSPAGLVLPLGSLPYDECRQIAAQFCAADKHLMDDCILRSGGNPLFLVQLLQHADASAGGAIPATIMDAINSRLASLPEPEGARAACHGPHRQRDLRGGRRPWRCWTAPII